jgi:tRNA(fMet)-specific endonuclease VapC
MWMLDTNICSYILKNRPVSVREKLKACDIVTISSIVYAELRYGIALSPKQQQASRQAQLDQLLSLLNIIDWNPLAAEHYADIRAVLKMQGNIIGNMDLLIAAHARSLSAILVTNNIREFERVDGLQVENWV